MNTCMICKKDVNKETDFFNSENALCQDCYGQFKSQKGLKGQFSAYVKAEKDKVMNQVKSSFEELIELEREYFDLVDQGLVSGKTSNEILDDIEELFDNYGYGYSYDKFDTSKMNDYIQNRAKFDKTRTTHLELCEKFEKTFSHPVDDIDFVVGREESYKYYILKVKFKNEETIEIQVTDLEDINSPAYEYFLTYNEKNMSTLSSMYIIFKSRFGMLQDYFGTEKWSKLQKALKYFK